MTEATGIGALLVWLLVSAIIVDIEYYDGFDAICNAAYFLGHRESYNGVRMPLVSWLLIPAEFARRALDLHPLEVRPHHLTMAILHASGVLGVYALLVRVHGRTWATLLAFAMATTTYVFFSYAPFLSHDILPGVMLLWMLVLGERFQQRPTRGVWSLLVALGAAAALIKQTYGLFWVALMVAPLLLRLWEGAGRPLLRNYLLLGLGAVASGVVWWLATAYSLSSTMPDVPFLWRPGEQTRHMFEFTREFVFPRWIYLRNLPAYGVVASLLIIPGLVISLGGTRLQRSVGLAWVLLFVAMHVLRLREVRYIAFLMPLSAFIIVPVLKALLHKRAAALGVLTLWAVSLVPGVPYSPISEAAQIFSPFYRYSQTKAFLAPLEASGSERASPLVINWNLLSFAPHEPSPLAGDAYHRLFHLGKHHLATLYDYPRKELVFAPAPQRIRRIWPDSTAFILTSDMELANDITWKVPGPPLRRDTLEQTIYRARSTPLLRGPGGSLRTAAGAPVVVTAHPAGIILALTNSPFEVGEFPRLGAVGGSAVFAVQRLSSRRLQVVGLHQLPPGETPLRLQGFQRQRLLRNGQ